MIFKLLTRFWYKFKKGLRNEIKMQRKRSGFPKLPLPSYRRKSPQTCFRRGREEREQSCAFSFFIITSKLRNTFVSLLLYTCSEKFVLIKRGCKAKVSFLTKTHHLQNKIFQDDSKLTSLKFET